jgi:GT2 family glycosyltransferase
MKHLEWGDQQAVPCEPKVQLVVLTYNGAAYVPDLIHSIRGQDYSRIGLTVVDNGSSDATLDVLRELLEDEDELIVNTGNLGCARGYNAGAKTAGSADVLCFLNQDIVLDSHYCSAMVDRFQEDPSVWALQPLVRYLDRPHIVENCGHTVDEWIATSTVGHGKPLTELTVPKRIMLTLTAPAVRGHVFRQLGGFDEALFIYYEDTDFSLRIWKAGGRIAYAPRAVVDHVQAASAAHEPDAWHAFLYARNRVRLLWKHADSPGGLGRLAAAICGGAGIASVLLPFRPAVARSIFRGLGWNLSHWRDNEAQRRTLKLQPTRTRDLIHQGTMTPSGGPAASARKALLGRRSWESTGGR